MLDRSWYLSFRRKFEPSIVKLVIVAESPPASGKYFYNPAGKITEPLFAALMEQIRFDPVTKESGLQGMGIDRRDIRAGERAQGQVA